MINLEDWQLSFTVVAAYCAIMTVQEDVPRQFQDKVLEIIWNRLDSFHKMAQYAYRDLVNFIEIDLKTYDKNTVDPSEGALHVQQLAGLWFVWNSTDNKL